MATTRFNFTMARIDQLPTPEIGRRTTYCDNKVNGLQLRITSNGVKTFSVYRWVKGASKPERITLGRYFVQWAPCCPLRCPETLGPELLERFQGKGKVPVQRISSVLALHHS